MYIVVSDGIFLKNVNSFSMTTYSYIYNYKQISSCGNGFVTPLIMLKYTK